MKKLVSLFKAVFNRAEKYIEKRPLVIFDVPYNRFDEVFKNCGFAVRENSFTFCERETALPSVS